MDQRYNVWRAVQWYTYANNVTNVTGMTAPGVYVFKFSALDNGNLTSSATTEIIVSKAPVATAALDSNLATAAAPALMASTDSSSWFDQPLSLFPNPNRGTIEFHLNVPITGRLKVDVFSPSGNLVKEFILTKTTTEMDTPLSLDGLAPGDYILVAAIGNWRQTRKLVKI